MRGQVGTWGALRSGTKLDRGHPGVWRSLDPLCCDEQQVGTDGDGVQWAVLAGHISREQGEVGQEQGGWG